MSELLKKFHQYKDSKIAIYGLGTETEKVLNEIGREVQIVGLLDGYREEGVLYGKPIVSMSTVLEEGVKLILVVARPGSCKAIAKRISKICRENQIALIDIRGKDLCEQKKVTYDFGGMNGITKKYLAQLVAENEVISIDLFDTLIMRQTLFPTDIFSVVDARLREQGVMIEDFCKKRLDSEKHLSKFTAPSLVEIYTYMRDTYTVLEKSPEELAQLEWSIDYEMIIPRFEMCDFMAEIYHMGKDIYIVSDTFYSTDQLKQLLDKCGIICYTEIFASCEYKTGKTGQLFAIVKDRFAGKKCIHIGDDLIADVESTKKHGIASCQIYSGLELLEQVGYLGVWENIDRLADRIKVGMFVSRLFNSPFQFETKEQRIGVKSAYDIGYLFFAPMITDFMIWFQQQVQKYELKNIWFSARDGYLIQKLYNRLTAENGSIYFLTSRTAAIRAGVQGREDIEYVEKMKFSGSLSQQLQERFGITVDVNGIEAEQDGLLRYCRQILQSAAAARENYLHYIERLNVKEGDIAFFDFVAKGTTQLFIKRMVKNHIKGLYFLQLERESMKGLDVLSFYDTEEKDNSAIYENYYILETIITSPEPSVEGFDNLGQSCYAEETRKKKDIECCAEVQKGIQEYFDTYLRLCPVADCAINKKLDETFLMLIQGIQIQNSDFIGLQVEDPFYNRVTDMADLICEQD